MRSVLLPFAVMLITAFFINRSEAAPAWVELHKPHTHKEMPYRLMTPLNFDKSKKYPVIISLHGAGGKGNDNKKQLKNWNAQLAEDQVRKDYPCYVLAPQAKGLWDKSHFDKIKEIIKELPAVDMGRIYILGHSMGGHGTFIMIQLEPSYFAAAAPSAGAGLKSTKPFIDASKIKDIPIWTFHGDNDKVCPYAKVRTVFEEVKKLGGNMKLTSWKGGSHGVSGKFIPGDKNSSTETSSDNCDKETDFLKWLFKQKRVKK
jgi:predicted peptidase